MGVLGKGLQSLIPIKQPKEESSVPVVQSGPINEKIKIKVQAESKKALAEAGVDELPRNASVFLVEVDKISPNPYQPRVELDRGQLLELALSIKEYGIIQPLVVSKKIKENERGQDIEYYLIAGHRRLEAAKMAGLPHVPVVVRNTTDQQKLELALIENIQRADLNAIEKARAFSKLHQEFGLTHEAIGKKIGKSRELVTNTIRLLNLPGEVQRAVIEGKISEGHARGLAGIKDKAEIMRIFKEMLNSSMTVREVEERAKQVTVKEHVRRSAFLSEVKEYMDNLTGFLGRPVRISKRGIGGNVVIPFKDKEELDTIIKRITR